MAGLKDQIAAGRAAARARTVGPPASSSRRSGAGPASSSAGRRHLPRPWSRGLADVGIVFSTLARARRRRPRVPRRGVRAPDLPGAHAARRRSRAPVPVHLDLSLNLAVVRRPGHRRAALRPGQGAVRCCPASWSCPTASGSCRSSRSSPPTSTSCSPAWTSSTIAFRVTRNADLTLEEEEADDLLAAVEMELRRRRFGEAVRLEVEDDISGRGARAARARARPDRRRRGARRRAARSRRAVGAARARPARPQGPRGRRSPRPASPR